MLGNKKAKIRQRLLLFYCYVDEARKRSNNVLLEKRTCHIRNPCYTRFPLLSRYTPLVPQKHGT